MSVKTTKTEVQTLTHAQIVEAITRYVVDRTTLESLTDVVVDVRPDCSWEAEGKNEYGATVTLVEVTES